MENCDIFRNHNFILNEHKRSNTYLKYNWLFKKYLNILEF